SSRPRALELGAEPRDLADGGRAVGEGPHVLLLLGLALTDHVLPQALDQHPPGVGVELDPPGQVSTEGAADYRDPLGPDGLFDELDVAIGHAAGSGPHPEDVAAPEQLRLDPAPIAARLLDGADEQVHGVDPEDRAVGG